METITEAIDHSGTTTAGILARQATLHRDETAIMQDGRTVTFAQLDEAASAFAAGLMKLGINKGDRVGIWMQNYPEWVMAWFGISRAGAVAVPMDHWYKASEAEYILGHSESVACVTADIFGKVDFLQMLGEIRHRLPGLKNVISVPNKYDGRYADPTVHSFRDILDSGRTWKEEGLLEKRRKEFGPGDVAFILYTSGTTGQPKGAQLTHRNICINASEVVRVLELDGNDNILVPLPFSHCFGCVLGITVAMAAGCAVTPILVFEPRKALEMIHYHRASVIHGVPTMFIRILEVLGKENFDTTSLRTGIMAGAPCPVDTMQGVTNVMGCNICIGYGLTEASPIITMTRHEDPMKKRVETVGRPISDVEVRIVDEDNIPVARGEVGELCCRGPNVFAGYFRDPEKTAETIDADGWLHSGDLAVEDRNGYYSIVGRKKDMVIVGGFNVYPREIEEYLIAFPDIMNIAVLGVPDHDLGEVVFAVVEPEHSARDTLTTQDIVDRCYGEMASAKVPRFVAIEGNIPVSGRGKIQKFKMRQALAQRIEDGEFEKLTPTAVKEKLARKIREEAMTGQ